MNFGIVPRTQVAEILAGRLVPAWRVPERSLLAVVIRGLLPGYAARIACGCSIGACFSGIASRSLHALVWLAARFFGNIPGHSSQADVRAEL